MTRCILYSNESGSREGCYFTEDLEMNAADVIPPDCTLSKDFTLDDDFPSIFPLEYNMEKRI